MAAPLGSNSPSKGELIAIRDGLLELVSHGIIATSTTEANIQVAIAAELAAR